MINSNSDTKSLKDSQKILNIQQTLMPLQSSQVISLQQLNPESHFTGKQSGMIRRKLIGYKTA
jgi:hypothetical protein